MDLDDMRKRQRAAADAAGAPAATKSMRREDDGLDFSQALGESLYNIWQSANKGDVPAADRNKVEVEIRLGMVISEDRRWKGQASRKRIIPIVEQMRQSLRLRFEAGVDEHYLEHLGHVFASDKFEKMPQPIQRVRCDETSRRRWVVDSSDRVSVVEEKRRFSRVDLALLSHNYDLRMDAAIEMPIVELSLGELNPDRWHTERLKRRVTYRAKNPQMSAWKIDVTEVDVSQRSSIPSTAGIPKGGKQCKEIEVEFELESRAAVAWLSEDPAAAVEHTKSLVWQLTQLINLSIPGCEEIAEENLREAPKDSLREICRWNDVLKSGLAGAGSSSAMITSSSLGKIEFLGSMPVNMNRKSLLSIQQNPYFITEKSDGTRYLLYVIKDERGEPLAVIMDRAKKVFCFRGAEAIGAALCVGTVLDGELVYNRTMKETVFLVFDILAMDGTPVLQMPFSRRLDLITKRGSGVIARCDPVAAASVSAPPAARPVLLVRKNFVDKARITELLSNIRMDERDGERTYRDSDRRHHKTDGIIFQPDAPYKFFADTDLLKWKWTDLRSVDLQAVVGNAVLNSSGVSNPPPVQLFCSGPDGSQVDCTKRGGLGTFDSYRLKADVEDLRAPPQVPRIAEVVFDAALGQWIYMKLREDKTDPNYIDTVMGVFLEQAEAISIEELEYRMLLPPGAEDDFAVQLQKMKKKLLEFQRSKRSSSSGGGGAGAAGSSARPAQSHSHPPVNKS